MADKRSVASAKALVNPKDKKMTREEKSMKYKAYIGNKTEGQGFADKRKRRTVYQYLKLETKEKQEENKWTDRVQKIYAEVDSSDEDDKPVKKKKTRIDVASKSRPLPESAKVSVFHREEKQWQQQKLEKDKRSEEMAAKAKAKLEATEQYRKEKRRKHKLLAKKNFKGQPNMSARMSLLLEKIEMQNKS